MDSDPTALRFAVDGRPVGTLENAATFSTRLRGLLRRDGVVGAMLLSPARSVHTLGMRFAIDVAHLNGRGDVLAVTTMSPWRIGRRVSGTRQVLEAEAGAFVGWGLGLGSRVSVVPACDRRVV